MDKALDRLPPPDYDEYFASVAAVATDWEIKPQLVLETSRGCWWGEKNHCTFCGLNGLGLRFRRKSQLRSIEEIESLVEKYAVDRVAMVDNILDMEYFQEYLPWLASRNWNVTLFYETKANLRKEQIRLLRAAGVRNIQPGIESLSDEVLGIMRKGVRGIQNVQLLKWCLELDVRPEWNLLWGFPGESADEYSRMARVIPRLAHLPPPHGASRIRLDRFSPNHSRASEFGLIDVRPYPAYEYVYRLGYEELLRIAYFFTFRYADGRNVTGYTESLSEAVETWRCVHPTSVLIMVDKLSHLLVWDTRPCATSPLTVLDGIARWVYLQCDRHSNLRAVTARAQAQLFQVDSDTVAAVLDALMERNLVYYDNGSYLALAVALDTYRPTPSALDALIRCIRSVASDHDGELRIPLKHFRLKL